MSRKQGPVENTEYAQMVKRMVRSYGRRIAESDWTDLQDMAEIQQELDKAMAHAVHGMRERQGFSWADIGQGLGITRQAAQQRFGSRKEA